MTKKRRKDKKAKYTLTYLPLQYPSIYSTKTLFIYPIQCNKM